MESAGHAMSSQTENGGGIENANRLVITQSAF